MSTQNTRVQDQLSKQPKVFWRNALVIGISAIVVFFSLDYIDYKGLTDTGIEIAFNIIKSVFTPNLPFLLDFTTKTGVPYLLLETAAIAFLGTIMGSIVSIPLAFLSSRNIVPSWFTHIGVAVITVIRTFPAVVYGLMFIRVTGPGAFTGVLTLAIASVGMVSKLFIETIEELDPGIIEALDASGCSGIQKVQYEIIPQLMSNFLSIASSILSKSPVNSI